LGTFTNTKFCWNLRALKYFLKKLLADNLAISGLQAKKRWVPVGNTRIREVPKGRVQLG